MSLPDHDRLTSPITWRSVLLGLLGVVLICGLTPYNDYALNNTFLVGNNLPLGVMMLLFFMAVFLNGPLSKWKPQLALSSGEIAVAFAMTLVGCALPSSGLLRYLAPTLVVPFAQAPNKPDFMAALEQMHLPRWLFPAFASDRPRDWASDPLVWGFNLRLGDDEPVPYRAWLAPIVAWGIFSLAMYAGLLCLCAIVRRQWFDNERLPFPLAQIQVALIEAPPPGRFFNSVLSRRSFWLAFAAVFLLHIWRGLAKTFPKYFPDIPVFYDLEKFLGFPPWTYADIKLKNAAIFFSVLGVTFFLSSPVAFSLFAFYLLLNVVRMVKGSWTGDADTPWLNDQTTGGAFAFALAILWVGRHHWRLVIAQAFRGPRPGEPVGRYMSYPFAFWGFVASVVVMTVWLVLAGCTLGGAVTLVALLYTGFMVLARIIAETGLVHGSLRISMVRPWQMIVTAGLDKPVPLETFYVGSMLQTIHYDFREVVPVYATHAMRVFDHVQLGDRAATDVPRAERRAGRALMGLMMLALVVAYGTSFVSTLWTEYRYAYTKDVSHKAPINDWGAWGNVELQTVDATAKYHTGGYVTRHDPLLAVISGAGFTAILSILRFRYTWWPLHPIGFLICGTFPSQHLWLSIFVGWLCKIGIVKYGGPKMYEAAKPFFVGLIVGESAAAGFWLIVTIVLSALDVPYSAINIMPG